MKTRNGFVSNSSSSSFVVVFPKRPKSVKEVFDILFNGENREVKPYDFDDGLTTLEIAENVFRDIKSRSTLKKTTKGEINKSFEAALLEQFSHRYHYNPKGSCIVNMGRHPTDKHGGWWDEHINEFCLSDDTLRDKLAALVTKYELAERNRLKRQAEIMESCPVPLVPYAYKEAKNKDGKRTYTDEQVKASDASRHARQKWQDENEEYQRLRKRDLEDAHKYWDACRKLEFQIAKIDLENFLRVYKDQFIFLVEYADEDGNVGCIMEHGEIFGNVPHIRISHH